MIINGTPVNFAFTGTNGIVITGISGTLLQSADVSADADKDDTRTAGGDVCTHSWYDQHLKATLEWVVTGTGLANAITNTAVAAVTPGSIIAITACASMPDLIGSNWEVMSGAKESGSNTNCKKLSVPLEKRALITAVASS